MRWLSFAARPHALRGSLSDLSFLFSVSPSDHNPSLQQCISSNATLGSRWRFCDELLECAPLLCPVTPHICLLCVSSIKAVSGAQYSPSSGQLVNTQIRHLEDTQHIHSHQLRRFQVYFHVIFILCVLSLKLNLIVVG